MNDEKMVDSREMMIVDLHVFRDLMREWSRAVWVSNAVGLTVHLLITGSALWVYGTFLDSKLCSIDSKLREAVTEQKIHSENDSPKLESQTVD